MRYYVGSTVVSIPVSASTPTRSGSSLAANENRGVIVEAVNPAVIVTQYNTGDWDAVGIRENDGVVYDAATGLWACAYSGRDSLGQSTLGLVTSSDASTWSPASNPISGATLGEDPYIVRKVDGTMYRDANGLAYLYCEEKVSIVEHRGVDLWRSGANALTGWTRYGRVLDRAASGFGSQDRTSPTVVHDSTQFVMLFEGRNAGNDGEIGYATSSDGLSFTADTDPIVVRGSANTWNSGSVVPDEIIKIGSQWVLLVHGYSNSDNYRLGRYVTVDAPADWNTSSFVEMIGNPAGGTDAVKQCMAWGNDPSLTALLVGATQLVKARILQA